MMRSILVFCLITEFGLSAFAQKVIKVEKASEHSTYVKGDDFEGVIFDKESKFSLKYKRFTPTIKQIEAFEDLIRGELDAIFKAETNARKKHLIPEILKKLTEYRRQYFGYIDQKGHKVIEAHFLLNKDLNKNWIIGEVFINGNGIRYWQLKSFGTDTLFEFNVNRPR